jgi:hypothetical protein
MESSFIALGDEEFQQASVARAGGLLLLDNAAKVPYDPGMLARRHVTCSDRYSYWSFTYYWSEQFELFAFFAAPRSGHVDKARG